MQGSRQYHEPHTTMKTISKATLNDIPQLADLLCLLFTQEADFQPDVETQCTGLRRIIENPDAGTILVLRDGPAVVGMVNVLYTISTACGGRVAIIEDMVVRPEHRGQGAGTSLLQGAIDLARAAGCRRITLLTDRTNASAIRFYRRHSFVMSEMIPLRLEQLP
ncbi:MAG: GNAT family N-acetyltransferase [Desulfomonilaceae bacterium]|nr:GNAT family N-acetyltransferase [Desulfomonilaceae bacterium]